MDRTLAVFWKKMPLDRKAELILIAAGVMFTGYQAWSAASSVEQAQEMLASQVRYESLRSSYVDLVHAQAAYSTELTEIRNRLPFDIEEQGIVNELSAGQIDEIQKVVEPITAAKRTYSAQIQAAMPLWPKSIRAELLEVHEHGLILAACYEAAALRALNAIEVNRVKTNLNKRCRNLGEENRLFNEDAEAAYILMANLLYDALESIGASPDE